LAEIEFDSVQKIYADGTQAVHDLDLEITDGELMVLVGPSGCGKTTALRMLAGLEEITDGEIRIGERVVNDLTPKDRDIAMVFQSYALYPHMTVEQNLAFGLKLRKLPKRKPRALSGGQRQRVAMGRAIVREPQAFLMDEPLSNLDAKLRVTLRAEIHQLQRSLGVTTIYVTHDQVEAMTMGDRVAVMQLGHLQQVDTPQVLYDQPVNEFVAGFIGSPSINLLHAELQQEDGRLFVSFADYKLAVDDQLARNRSALADYIGRTVMIGIRPEDFEDASLEPDTPADRRISATADLTEPLGSEVLVYFSVEATGVISSAVTADAAEGDADLYFGGGNGDAPEVVTRVVARVSPRTRIAVGSKIELTVDTSRLYFFDPETRNAI
jgi:multiple sugar transport system ATP-binding protein